MVSASPSTVVRTASVDDADSVGRIHVEAWRAAYVDILPEAFLRGLSIPDRQRGWRQRLTAPDRKLSVLVVLDGEVVAGFACVGGSRDEDAPTAVGELQSIYLAPENWGRGLGRCLHEEAAATLRRAGYARATLWVLDANARARRFYEGAGWVLDGATKVDSIADSPPVTEVRYTRTLEL